MTVIKIIQHFFVKKVKSKAGQGQKSLILLITLPCLLITLIALLLAAISPYLIAFIMIILSLIAVYVVVTSEQRAEYQIRTLSNIIESMIGGDYTLRGRLQTNPAFQELLNLVNNLSETLSLHKIEAKESRQLLERIMEQMDAMVLAIDEQGLVVMANASAKKLLLNNATSIEGIVLSQLEVGRKVLASAGGLVVFNDDKPEHNANAHQQSQLYGEHFLFKESFLSDGRPHQLYMLTSAERLLMEKERQAWQSLLRVLSHEMNNSLTPISAISQSMKQKLSNTDKALNRQSLLEGVGIIHERAGSLTNFIARYSQLSHLPLPTKAQFKISQLIDHCTALFSDYCFEYKNNNDVNSFIDNKLFSKLSIEGDKSQLQQVFINVFKNAVEAMTGSAQAGKNIAISCQQESKWLRIIITDQGQGLANKDNLFVPFYSTKPLGSGIGLCLCRQILFNHGGTIALNNNSSGIGAHVILSLPYHKELIS